MNSLTISDQYGISVTIETEIESIWDWEFVFAGILTMFGYSPENIKELFHQYEL